MQLLHILSLLAITSCVSCQTTHRPEYEVETPKDHYLAKRAMPFYDFINQVASQLSRYGKMTAWGAFGLCTIDMAGSVYLAYSICKDRENRHEVPPTDCFKAIMSAARRCTIAGVAGWIAVDVAITSDKREENALHWSTIMMYCVIMVLTLKFYQLMRVLR